MFRCYSANGKNLLGDYYTVTADVTLSAVMESMVAGTVQLPESSVYTLTVTKTGTAYVDGEAVSVTDAPVVSGDPIYENDVLTVKAAVKDGVYPEDNDYVYSGKFDFVFAYQDGASSPETKRNLLSTKFTVARTDAPLVITAVPKTTGKTWLDVADTSWYSDSGTAFTITTARQLAGLAQLVNDKTDTFSGKTVRLGNDISLRNDDGTSGTLLWSGIGTSGSFNGTFDGAGHAITQMTASTSGSVALFVTCSGAVWTALNVNGCFTRGEQGYPELSTIPAAYAIRGRVDAGGRSVTVTLKESGQTVQTLTGIVDGFQLSLRANGSYSLLFEAEGCVSHQIVILQDFTGLLDTVMLCRAGDVNMDGVLDVYDLQRLYEDLNGLDPLTDDYARLLADANRDGGVTAGDVQWLYEYLLAASGT